MKYFFVLLLLFLHNLTCVLGSFSSTEEKLIEIRHAIESKYSNWSINRPISDLNDRLSQWTPQYLYVRFDPWETFTNGFPVLIHQFIGRWTDTGNFLGVYFEAVSCADIAHMHFLTVNTEWIVHNESQLQVNTSALNSFISLIPNMRVYEQQQACTSGGDEEGDCKGIVRTQCKCSIFCWQDENAAWVKRVPLVRSIFSTTLREYSNMNKFSTSYLSIDSSVDILTDNVVNRRRLPLIPDVLLHLRCSDILHHRRYGFMPFKAYLPLIPANARYIYVTSDHPGRQGNDEKRSNGRGCTEICRALHTYLSTHYPHATVVVKRGEDVLIAMAQMFLANVTICSASTFCLWPAVAKIDNIAYFPLSGVVLNNKAVDLGPNFKWLKDKIINFHNNELVEDIIATLTNSNEAWAFLE